jgi:hypothetical protein
MSLNLLSCGKKGDSWVYAISPGSYSLTGPFCVSTGKSPLYDSVAKSVNLFDFTGVTTNELRFEESGVQRVIASDSCKMTVKHKVQENKNNIFALQLARSFIFEPAECILQATIGATIYNVSSSSTSVLQDSDAKGSDIPFEITQVGPNLEMTSINRDALNSVWADYGCASPDRIKWILVHIPPS